MSASSSRTSPPPTIPARGSSTGRSRTHAQELGRQERNITPVDLAANEIYDILRKRLFKSLPDKAEIGDIADAFGRKLEEAAKSKTANRGAEAIADEIAATYPVPSPAQERHRPVQGERAVQADARPDRAGVPPAQVGLGAPGQRRLPHRPPALRPVDPRGARQAHRDLRHARRHRQGPLGCPAIGPRPGHRSPDRQGSRHPGRLPAPHRQPFDRRQRREGAHTRGDGRMPRLAAARAIRFPRRLRGAGEGRLVSPPHAGGPLLLRPPGEPHQAPAEPRPRCPGQPGRRPDPPPPARDVQAQPQDGLRRRPAAARSWKRSPTASGRGASCSSSAPTQRSRPRRSRSSSRA